MQNIPSIFKNKRYIDITMLIMAASVMFMFFLPFFKDINNISKNEDWLQIFAFNHITRMSIIDFHQLPLWTPYYGGGLEIAGHPYQGFLNPFIGFVLFLGEVVGVKIIIFLICLLGVFGMYYLTRITLGFHPLGAAFSSLVYGLSSYLPHQLNDGNYCLSYIFLLPWPVALFLNSLETNKLKYKFFCAIFLSFLAFQSGFSFIVGLGTILLISIVKTVNATRNSCEPRINLRSPKIFLVIALVTILFSAVKLIPMVRFVESRAKFVHAEFEDSYEEMSKQGLKDAPPLDYRRLYESLFVKRSKVVLPTTYTGLIPACFALLAIFLAWKKNLVWSFILLFFLLLSMGSLAPIDIYKIIWSTHKYFHFIYKPNKYFSIGIIFSLAILSGSFISTVLNTIIKKRVKYIIMPILTVTCLFSIAELYITDIDFYKNIFTETAPSVNKQNDFFQIFIKDVPTRRPICKSQYLLLLQNVGLINWHSSVILRESALPRYISTFSNWGDFRSMEINQLYKGEIYFLNKSNNADCVYFSPNKISINVQVRKPDILVLNQNYNAYWEIKRGKLASYNGLLAVKLDKIGSYQVDLNFVPKDFLFGFLISIGSFIIVLLLVIKDEFKRKD